MAANQYDESAGDILIDEDELPIIEQPTVAPWRVLIVDDDVDVHVVTKFALSNASFQGRRISFLHAYSGKEALESLRNNADIALVLLDVIMETDDAGLKVASKIRSELHNELTRIVLRTGQPGQALEHSIIVEYDINDFWCKADLTTRKLFTTVISSLRAYASLSAAAQIRIDLKATLDKVQHVQAALDQHALVLHLDLQGRILDANDKLCQLAGVRRESLYGRGLHALHPQPFPEDLAGDIHQGIAREGRWQGDIHTPSGLKLRCTILKADARIVAIATVL